MSDPERGTISESRNPRAVLALAVAVLPSILSAGVLVLLVASDPAIGCEGWRDWLVGAVLLLTALAEVAALLLGYGAKTRIYWSKGTQTGRGFARTAIVAAWALLVIFVSAFLLWLLAYLVCASGPILLVG